MSSPALRMRDVVEQTGIGEATLRAWEQRYGFPEPHRLPSGHRRSTPPTSIGCASSRRG